MEQRGLDINFVIGIFLMLGILMWFNFNQAPTNSESDVINTTTELKPSARDNLPKTDFVKPENGFGFASELVKFIHQQSFKSLTTAIFLPYILIIFFIN